MTEESKLIDVWRVNVSQFNSRNPIEHVMADKITDNSVYIDGRRVKRVTTETKYLATFSLAKAAALEHLTESIDATKRRLQRLEHSHGLALKATEENVPMSTSRY